MIEGSNVTPSSHSAATSGQIRLCREINYNVE